MSRERERAGAPTFGSKILVREPAPYRSRLAGNGKTAPYRSRLAWHHLREILETCHRPNAPSTTSSERTRNPWLILLKTKMSRVGSSFIG